MITKPDKADGLRRNAQAKRREAFEKVERGIQQLIKEKRPINFNQVAEASGVSKAWLYKEPEVKARIDHLRAQSKQGKKLPRNISASEASTKAINTTLQKRIKKLESENCELRKQNEVAYGQVIQVRDLKKQIERLKIENQKLRHRSELPHPQLDRSNLPKLERLGVQMNSTIKSLIDKTPQGILKEAITTLEEAIESGEVKNPSGFLNSAICLKWKPNEKLKENEELTQFNNWWPIARNKGLVVGSEQVEGVLYVYMSNGKVMPFSEALQTFSV